MSVNVQAAINRVFQEYDQTLLQAFQDFPRVASSYAMEVPSSSRSTIHAWLANQAVVREWLGKRVLNSMGTRVWEVINRDFELSYSFEVNQILDDLEGLVASALMTARGDGAKWAKHEELLCAQTLEAGDTKLCWDGQFYFDTDHPIDFDGLTSGTYANLLTNTPLTFANFDTAFTALHSFKQEDGAPIVADGTKIRLVVPRTLALKGKQIVSIPQLTPAAAYGLFANAGASDNPFCGTAELVINDYLQSQADWYVTAEDAGGMIKPIMFQRRQAVEKSEQGYGSPLYFEEKKVAVGSDSRYEASYTMPQLAVKCRAGA